MPPTEVTQLRYDRLGMHVPVLVWDIAAGAVHISCVIVGLPDPLAAKTDYRVITGASTSSGEDLDLNAYLEHERYLVLLASEYPDEKSRANLPRLY